MWRGGSAVPGVGDGRGQKKEDRKTEKDANLENGPAKQSKL